MYLALDLVCSPAKRMRPCGRASHGPRPDRSRDRNRHSRLGPGILSQVTTWLYKRAARCGFSPPMNGPSLLRHPAPRSLLSSLAFLRPSRSKCPRDSVALHLRPRSLRSARRCRSRRSSLSFPKSPVELQQLLVTRPYFKRRSLCLFNGEAGLMSMDRSVVTGTAR